VIPVLFFNTREFRAGSDTDRCSISGRRWPSEVSGVGFRAGNGPLNDVSKDGGVDIS
jgi:hypothetical protein